MMSDLFFITARSMIRFMSFLALAMALPPVLSGSISSSIRNSPESRHLQDASYFDDIDLSEVSLCGCGSCYDKGFFGYQTRSGEASCAQRIMQLIAGERMPEEAACRKIAKEDFIPECATLCDIDICDGKAIMNAEEQDKDPPKTFCGCAECNEDVWLTMAGEFTCGARISWLTGRGQTSTEACRTVAAHEYADVCGPCSPDTCQHVEATTTTVSEVSSEVYQPSPQPALEDIPLTPEFPLYCFPPYSERIRYGNVWGKYTVEVKESENACGPSDNLFSNDTVQVQDDELTLQFKKVGESWMGSEVRVVLPWEDTPFHYGEYSFSVKSIQVIDSASGSVVDTVLPITMILGLFTWDATESYAIHVRFRDSPYLHFYDVVLYSSSSCYRSQENYNHEVDIEISRWNTDGLADVQYLVQPPGDPHKYRFFSGEGETYQQAPNTYVFDWRPAEIEWNSTAGGGRHQFTYATQDAIDANAPDYVQCLPADVEVRINLWNLFGSSPPPGLEDTHRVDVVIDSFQFTPSGLTGLSEGGTCSRDCHCDGSAKCLSNVCSSLGTAMGTKPLTNGSGSHTPAGDSPMVTSFDQGGDSGADSSGRDGVSRTGKAFLVLFMLAVVAGFGCWMYVRMKRSETHRSRIVVMFRDGNEARDTCSEKNTAELSYDLSAVETALSEESIATDPA
jgi:hypothetical protein